jgi:hypothetical protein
VLDLTKIKSLLGYRDVVPAREAVAHTARWLAEHPITPGGQEETVLTDPFDYPAEDALIDSWLAARDKVALPDFAVRPGWGLAYSGPHGRPRTHQEFVE